MDDKEVYEKYLKSQKIFKIKTHTYRILIIIILISIWEICSKNNFFNIYFISPPSKIIINIRELFATFNIFKHLFVTSLTVFVSFIISVVLGVLFSLIFYNSKLFTAVFEPFFIIFNCLPKIALAPIMIILCGHNITSILILSIFSSVTTIIINMLAQYNQVDQEAINFLLSFRATKLQIITNLIFPTSIPTFISTLKITLTSCWVGVLIGEMQVGKYGIGYLISYSSLIFKLDVVIVSIILLSLCIFLFYLLISLLEHLLSNFYL